jgi:SNF family Na+-dependent transporter
MILVLGLPTVIFLRKECLMNMIIGGTVKFSCFTMFETICFLILEWTKDGVRITSGADIKVPNIYKFIIKYITPVFLLIIIS